MSEGESFADAPVPISEARSAREGDASLWSARDALVHMLRMIDQGREKPQALAILFFDEAGDARYRIASDQKLSQTVGMIEMCKAQLMSDHSVRGEG